MNLRKYKRGTGERRRKEYILVAYASSLSIIIKQALHGNTLMYVHDQESIFICSPHQSQCIQHSASLCSWRMHLESPTEINKVHPTNIACICNTVVHTVYKRMAGCWDKQQVHVAYMHVQPALHLLEYTLCNAFHWYEYQCCTNTQSHCYSHTQRSHNNIVLHLTLF